jgi:hypothetical protein
MFNIGFFTTTHRHQCPIFSPNITTRNRCINTVNLLGKCALVYLFGEVRRAGCVVNEIRALLHILKNATARTEKHLFNVMRVSKHQEEIVDLLRDFLYGSELCSSCDKCISFRCCPIENLKSVAFGD